MACKAILIMMKNLNTIYILTFIITIIGCSDKRVVIDSTGAMSPTMSQGKNYFIRLLYYQHTKPQRWDIVLFNPFGDARTPCAMRIVGLPGETIDIHLGQLMIDGHALSLPNQLSNIVYQPPPFKYTNDFVALPMHIPAGMYYVLGDNPQVAHDSRYIGPVREKDIIGKIDQMISCNQK